MDQPTYQQRARHHRLHGSRWALTALLTLVGLAPLLSGCQINYLVKSAYYQANLLSSRVPIEKALQDERISVEQKSKLRIAQEARLFAESKLGLKKTGNYESFVQLGRPYVTYVVSASHKKELKAHNWRFPLVGSLPYKGFFDPESAKAEAEKLKAEGFDTYVRGVSAYSTLGWFRDPVLSSMLAYKEYDLVNTIIHETVHATIYIKSQADFNERMAVFFGNKGTLEFYRQREGVKSSTLQTIADDAEDEKLFSAFIFKEIAALEQWYAERKDQEMIEDERIARIKEIQTRFLRDVQPKLKLKDSYKNFATSELNNARLLTYRLYFENLDDFEAVFRKLGGDYHKMLEFCQTLTKSDDPEKDLAQAAKDAPQL